jgi:hypothetical protein
MENPKALVFFIVILMKSLSVALMGLRYLMDKQKYF